MTPNDSDRHNRRSVRLPDFNYSQAGYYYVTICTGNREPLFGKVVNGHVRLSTAGMIASEEWLLSPNIRDEVSLDEFVVMPNHIHGIVIITGVAGVRGFALVEGDDRGACHAPLRRPPRSLASFVAGFKGRVTRRVNAAWESEGVAVWQRNYFEHVIRDEEDLERIRVYILENPASWEDDEYYA